MVLHNFVERRNTAPDLNIPPDFVDPGLAHGARSGGAERVRGAKAIREGYVQYAQEHCGWWKRTHAATRSVARVHQPPTRLPGMGGANQKEDDMWESDVGVAQLLYTGSVYTTTNLPLPPQYTCPPIGYTFPARCICLYTQPCNFAYEYTFPAALAYTCPPLGYTYLARCICLDTPPYDFAYAYTFSAALAYTCPPLGYTTYNMQERVYKG
jgi:hypothetical protein